VHDRARDGRLSLEVCWMPLCIDKQEGSHYFGGHDYASPNKPTLNNRADSAVEDAWPISRLVVLATRNLK
jgi:hypothetical protein